MQKTIISIVLVLTAGILGSFVFLGDVRAASGLSISPLTFEFTANPGDTLDNKIRIYNPTESIVAVKMEVEDFTVSGETGQVLIEPAETETYSLAQWVQVSPEIFTLEPGEQKIVDFIITVPEGAEPGGHYGSVLATTAGAIGENFTGAGVAQKVGALVLLSVSGAVKENLQVKEFSAPEFSEYGPIKFLMRFQNTGTVHVRPKGFINITNWRGKKVADVEFPQKNVIPGATRMADATWNAKMLFGKYTATLVGSYGVSNTPLEPYVISFWVVPWKILSAAGAVLLVLLIFFFFSRKRWGRAIKILLKGE